MHKYKLRRLNKLTLIMSVVIIFGPMEENTTISGAGLMFRTVIVGVILPTGFL